MNIAVVTGGRDHRPSNEEMREFWYQMEKRSIEVVIAGGADGVDTAVAEACKASGIHVLTAHALWLVYGNSAGPRRNLIMVAVAALGNPVLIAFPGGRGTKNCIAQAKGMGVPVVYTRAEELQGEA